MPRSHSAVFAFPRLSVRVPTPRATWTSSTTARTTRDAFFCNRSGIERARGCATGPRPRDATRVAEPARASSANLATTVARERSIARVSIARGRRAIATSIDPRRASSANLATTVARDRRSMARVSRRAGRVDRDAARQIAPAAIDGRARRCTARFTRRSCRCVRARERFATARARRRAATRDGDGAREGATIDRAISTTTGEARDERASARGLTRRERARAEFGGVRRGDRRGGARGGEGVELRIRSRVGEVRGRGDATRRDATRATRARRAKARARDVMRTGIDWGFRRRFARSSNKGKLWKDVEKRLELE